MGCAEGRSPFARESEGFSQISATPPSWSGRGPGGWSKGSFNTRLGFFRTAISGAAPPSRFASGGWGVPNLWRRGPLQAAPPGLIAAGLTGPAGRGKDA